MHGCVLCLRSLTLELSTEVEIAGAADLDALAHMDALAGRDGAALDQVADGAAGSRAGGRIFAAVELHPGAVVGRMAVLLAECWCEYEEPAPAARPQPRRGLWLAHPESGKSFGSVQRHNREGRACGDNLRRQAGVQVVDGQPGEPSHLAGVQLRAKLRITLRHLAEEPPGRPVKRTGTAPTLRLSVTAPSRTVSGA